MNNAASDDLNSTFVDFVLLCVPSGHNVPVSCTWLDGHFQTANQNVNFGQLRQRRRIGREVKLAMPLCHQLEQNRVTSSKESRHMKHGKSSLMFAYS